MSARKTEQEAAARHPRATADLFGHREAETALLNAYRSGCIPHAWLIGGPQGIGKATLAYRMARFVLANAKPMAPSVQHAETETLALDPNAANALLKILEEPPQRSLFLLVSHSPARALPTILSRCRKLPLRPLATEDVIRAAARATGRESDDPALVEPAGASEGSVSRALTLLGGDALKLQRRTAALLATLPRVDPRELHALGDSLGISDRVALAAFIDGVERWVSERLRADDANANANLPRLARLAEVWEKIARAARDTAEYNLERKPLVFSVFGMLAEATR